MTPTRFVPAVGLLVAVVGAALAQDEPDIAPAPRRLKTWEPTPVPVPPPGYVTTAGAVKADPKVFKAEAISTPAAAGYLGVVVEGDKAGRPVIDAVEPGSPADAAGLKAGDVVLKIDAGAYTSAGAVRDALRSRLAGEKIGLTVQRTGKPVELAATFTATTRPMASGGPRAVIGINISAGKSGVRVDEVAADMPAAKAGMKAGDVITRLDGKVVETLAAFRELMAERRPGDRVDLLLDRDGKRVEARVVLAAEEQRGGRGGGWDDRLPGAWRKPSYRLAILGVEYPDVKHNPKIADAAWEASMFSVGRYTGKSATGETVHGSMNDYFQELSAGAFKIDGRFLGWVQAKKKRLDYSTGSGTDSREKLSLLTEALDLYLAKHGTDALKDYDGIFFLYAGGRVDTTRGGLYWPHRANVTHKGKRWPYFIVQEGGTRMNDISVFCHEFGHMLGLPDLYARPELPGSEGVGVWCAMSNQQGGGRPQHFGAWSKEQLGWVRPTVIDPRVRQKLVLSPVEDDPTQCVKVMVRADGSEYFLLENRRKKGFDGSLPAEGLLIWRVVNNRPVLEESHGVEGSTGPRVFLGDVPFPSKANAAFTPYTTPSSKSQLGGGLPVYITNIRKLPDGRVTFHIGYEYQ